MSKEPDRIQYKTCEEVAHEYEKRIQEWLRYAYNEGYGFAINKKDDEIKNLREKHKREAGEYDDVYAKNWRDSTPFYGWCSGCKRPHSGRWAHVWNYCPWCGGKIDHTDEPYPLGRRDAHGDIHYSEK